MLKYFHDEPIDLSVRASSHWQQCFVVAHPLRLSSPAFLPSHHCQHDTTRHSGKWVLHELHSNLSYRRYLDNKQVPQTVNVATSRHRDWSGFVVTLRMASQRDSSKHWHKTETRLISWQSGQDVWSIASPGINQSRDVSYTRDEAWDSELCQHP